MKHTIIILLALMLCIPVNAKGLKGKLIYVNPGHGGWTANDRPLPTMNYEAMDTLGFFETKTNLIKGLELYHHLKRAGAKVIMSRTKNGYVTEGQANATSRDKVETESDANGQRQLTGLLRIAHDVEKVNPDYFISIHSNAGGTVTNYCLLMYRGEKDNEYAPGSIMRAKIAFPYIWDNDLTVWTSSSIKDPYIAGDISWMGGKAPGEANDMGYKGYLAVLKHKVPCFLAEGSFHSYVPERQRLMNRDYCRLEGIRYFRGINAFYNGKPEKKGYIAGTLKDASERITDPFYKYVEGSDDQWLPINYGTVWLMDKEGKKALRIYAIDNQFNGVFAFFDVKPGTYTLKYQAYGYRSYTEQIEVKADKTTYVKAKISKIASSVK